MIAIIFKLVSIEVSGQMLLSDSISRLFTDLLQIHTRLLV